MTTNRVSGVHPEGRGQPQQHPRGRALGCCCNVRVCDQQTLNHLEIDNNNHSILVN
jgi:hypothetical protein